MHAVVQKPVALGIGTKVRFELGGYSFDAFLEKVEGPELTAVVDVSSYPHYTALTGTTGRVSASFQIISQPEKSMPTPPPNTRILERHEKLQPGDLFWHRHKHAWETIADRNWDLAIQSSGETYARSVPQTEVEVRVLLEGGGILSLKNTASKSPGTKLLGVVRNIVRSGPDAKYYENRVGTNVYVDDLGAWGFEPPRKAPIWETCDSASTRLVIRCDDYLRTKYGLPGGLHDLRGAWKLVTNPKYAITDKDCYMNKHGDLIPAHLRTPTPLQTAGDSEFLIYTRESWCTRI